MFENPRKGWHGSYSRAGRVSAEQYQMILNKDKILNEKKKIKLKNLDFFSQNDEEEQKINENEIDIFSLPPDMDKQMKLKKKQGKKKEICTTFYSKDLIEKYKYHQTHHKDYKKFQEEHGYEPSSAKYFPKLDFIWPRTITGPKWEELSGRNNRKAFGFLALQNKTYYDSKSYLKHKDLIPAHNVFIQMNKQTERGDFATHNDVRIRNDKPFCQTDVNFYKPNKNNNKKNFSFDENSKMVSRFSLKNRASVLNKAIMNRASLINRGSILNRGSVLTRGSILKRNNNRLSIITNTDFNKINKLKIGLNNGSYSESNHIKAPDFNKTISREKLSWIERDKDGIRPFFTPSYKLVTPKTITMVTYKEKHKSKKPEKRMKGLEENLMFDKAEAMYNINNNKRPQVPNFKIMVSRPNDKGPLPSYMIKKFDREALNNITQKSLKMNGFSDGKFMTEYSSFFPKKSFNQKINLSLLNNDDFLLNNNMGEVMSKLGSNGAMSKVMEFYTKNLDNITQENVSSKIDNITLKTVNKPKRISKREENLFKIDLNHDRDNNSD
jgi:hypothetical protein